MIDDDFADEYPREEHPINEYPVVSEDFFDEFKLTAEDLQEDVTYLVNDFLVEQSITMIFAKASQGKSYFVLFLSLMLLRKSKIKKCVYIDMDNGKKALKRTFRP